MTMYTETKADRGAIAEMIKGELHAHPEGVGPGRLVRDVVAQSREKHVYAAASEVQSTMFDLIANGIAEWTKKGPVRLRDQKAIGVSAQAG